MDPRVRRVSLAVLLSSSVYLVPLVAPHAFIPLGRWLARGITYGERPAAWIAAELGVALAMQAAAAVICLWILERPRSLRPLVLLAAVPIFVAVAQWSYLVALPVRFLVERDSAKEQRSWPIACTAPDRTLAAVGRQPVTVATGEALFVRDPRARLARLIVATGAGAPATCTVTPLALPAATANLAVAWIGGDDRALLMSIDRQSGALSWRWIRRRGAAPVMLVEPAGRRPSDAAPLISRDGRAIAWLTALPGSAQPPALAVVVRPLPAADSAAPPHAPAPSDVVIELTGPARGSFVVLLDLDARAREILLAVDGRRFVSVGFDGLVHWGPTTPDGIETLSTSFRRVGDGWVAWDGYREANDYSVAWSLPAGRGRHRVPRGRTVNDVAVHPDGRLIALSVTTALSIGATRDAVYVLRVADGTEVFRRYLPRYARSDVAFPARDLFAYTEWRGPRAEAVVLRIPPDALR